VKRILVAEDEPRIASFIEKGLSAAGFTTTVVGNGNSALSMARSGDYDLLILDLGLPGRDGYEVLQSLRQARSNLPVIVVTARDSIEDTVATLEGGADDYIAKPFHFEELLARVRLRISSDRVPEPSVLRAGVVALDLRTRRAIVDKSEVELSAKEFTLAEMFFRHPGQVLSKEQLLSRVWGYDFDPGSNVVEVYVRYLRRKLGDQTIKTIRGMGYRLEPQESPAAEDFKMSNF
jgi:DNA-binding response OmpR family regulator